MTGSKHFKGTEWLELETAVETIGDLIAHHVARLNEAVIARSDEQALAEIEKEIRRFSQERRQCYEKSSNAAVVKKALHEYSALLSKLSQKKSVILFE